MSQTAAQPTRTKGVRACAHVRIVMATHNGAAHLSQQLQSLVTQTHENWSLHVGDDGSDDDTRAQLRAFAALHPDRDISLVAGPCRGGAINFLTQAAAALRPGDWLAFADQDDVWLPHKLARALERMGDADALTAYSSTSILTDADLIPIATSPQHARPPGFANALVQNVLSGHATVLTPAAATLVAHQVQAATDAQVPFHDWWMYLLITGAGGRVVLDPEPGLYYRQHDGNAMGTHRGVRARAVRARQLVNRGYADWIDRNLAALNLCAEVLTPEARAMAERFGALRVLPRGRDRVRALTALGIYRQSAMGDRVIRLLARAGRL